MYIPKLTRRQVVIGTLALQAIGTIVGLLGLFAVGALDSLFIGSIYMLLTVGLLLAYLRGVDQARYAAVVLLTIVTVLAINNEFLYEEFSIAALMPMTVALLLTNVRWIIGCEVVTIILLQWRAGWTGPYVNPVDLTIVFMIAASLALSRKVTDDSQHTAQENERNALQAQARAEAQAQELAIKAQELTASTEELTWRNQQQQQLLDPVATLETPVIPLAEKVLFAPLIGHVDSRRAKMLTDRLLQAVSEQRAQLTILDITGVATVDTAVAKALIETAQALGLLGCKVVVSGISAAIATTLTHLDVDLAGISITRSPQEALAQYSLFSQTTASTTNGVRVR